MDPWPSHAHQIKPEGLTPQQSASWDNRAHGLLMREQLGEPARQPQTGWGSAALVCLFVAPFVLIGYAAFVVGEWVTHRSDTFRPIAETAFPESWVSRIPGQDGKPLQVALVVGGLTIAAIVLLTIVRRIGVVRWETGASGRGILFAWCFTLSLARTVVFVVGLVAVLAGIAIANAADLEADPVSAARGAGRWALAGVGVLLWSVFFTLRAMRTARR